MSNHGQYNAAVEMDYPSKGAEGQVSEGAWSGRKLAGVTHTHTKEFNVNGLTPTKAYKSILSNQASVQKGLSPTETTIRGDSHTPRQCKGRRILRKPPSGKGSQLISWFKWPHRCLWSIYGA